MVELLLSLGGDRQIDASAYHGRALVSACQAGHHEVVRQLLSLEGERRIDPTALDCRALRRTCTVLERGASRAVVRLLMTAGYDRLAPREVYDECHELSSRSGGNNGDAVKLPDYDYWLGRIENRPKAGVLLNFRRAQEAHRDFQLLALSCAEGRPLELQRRLVLGKLAGTGAWLEPLLCLARAGRHGECEDLLLAVL